MSRTPDKAPDQGEVKLTVPDEATQREVLRLWHQVDRLSRQGDIPTIRAGGAAPPLDEQSALAETEWTRTSRRRGNDVDKGQGR